MIVIVAYHKEYKATPRPHPTPNKSKTIPYITIFHSKLDLLYVRKSE